MRETEKIAQAGRKVQDVLEEINEGERKLLEVIIQIWDAVVELEEMLANEGEGGRLIAEKLQKERIECWKGCEGILKHTKEISGLLQTLDNVLSTVHGIMIAEGGKL